MKRLLLILILLLPAITLLIWVYRGMSMRPKEPPAIEQPANPPAETNLNQPPASK